ncbi:hypothetical protein BKI52_39675 [marine bacterium AO1-C]|nr:hypothetical protein BKI52_39675 [marine bacterium AO1-C]
MAKQEQSHLGDGDNIAGNKTVYVNQTLPESKNLPSPTIPTYYVPSEIAQAKKYYIPTRWQKDPPSEEQELSDAFLHNNPDLLIPHLMDRVFTDKVERQSDYKFFLVLADSGMGKTTFMLHLFMEWQAKKRSKEMRLYHIAAPQTWEEIALIKRLGKAQETILLLDAFDEDRAAVEDYQGRLRDIVTQTQDFYKIIITSRTQFFPTKGDILAETNISVNRGFQKIRHFYVAPFDNKDIEKYLNKRFGGNLKFWSNTKKRQAKAIVDKVPHLMARPMLLAYINDLLEHQKSYNNSLEIYEAMVARWIKREADRVPEADRQGFSEHLYQFSIDLAGHLYQNPVEGQYLIHYKALEDFARKHQINLSRIEMQSRSLLNRNALGYCKFSHKSVLEFFLLKKYLSNIEFAKSFDFGKMNQTRKFYLECGQQIIAKTANQIGSTQVSEKMLQTLNQANEGAHMIGANLSDRDLTNIDLNGAVLIGARFEKANMTKALLNIADLKGALFLLTDLTEAELRGTDMRGCILVQANFRGANLGGASLRWNDLRATILEEAILKGTDLRQTLLTDLQYRYAEEQGAVLSPWEETVKTFAEVPLAYDQ